MAFDPTNAEHVSRLGVAVDRSRWLQQPFRVNRFKLLQQYVGSHYGWSGSPAPVPLNMLQLAANIYLRNLVSRAPRCLVSAKDPQFRPLAADFEAWLNKQAIPGMRLHESLKLWVLNALFGLSVMKVGTAQVGSLTDLNGSTVAIGQPFAEVVDFDDWIHDFTAKTYPQCQFAGNRYRVPYEEARNNPAFDAEARAKLVPQFRYAYNERGDPRDTTLSQSSQQLTEVDLEDHVELWDIWLPREKLILTISYQDSAETGFSGSKPLRVVKWTGPSQGPYILLSFCDVPNNVQPAAPLAALYDLHELVNILWTKLARQGERQRENLFYRGNAADDAERFARGSDGLPIRSDFPQDMVVKSWGGIKPENLLGAQEAINKFDFMAGNLSTLGGLAAQAGTLGQEELLNKNSSAQVSEMQSRTVAGTREVMTHVAWHWYVNPMLTYETGREVAGENIPVQLTPQMRGVPFNRLGWDIDPYSMQETTPGTKLAGVMQLVQQILVPFQQQMAQQGTQVNYKGLLDLFVKYANITDASDLLVQGPPPEQQEAQQLAGEAKERTMPSNTTRTNVRINRPGGMGPQAHGKVLQQLLAGGGQPAEAAGLMRNGNG